MILYTFPQFSTNLLDFSSNSLICTTFQQRLVDFHDQAPNFSNIQINILFFTQNTITRNFPAKNLTAISRKQSIANINEKKTFSHIHIHMYRMRNVKTKKEEKEIIY